MSQGGTAMDLDIQERDRNGQLTQKAKDNRRRLGLCLRCAQKGHIAINCPMGV
jgi:hypothetical protein